MDLSIENLLAKREVRKAYGGGRLPLGTVVGDWKVAAFVGAGGSAEVYRVTGTKMDAEAALKLLVNGKPEYRERFMREMEVMGSLSVSSIPRFLGSGTYDGSPWYVMEYLQPVLFPVENPRDFAADLALAVDELHDSGYVHCDLKPTNILARKNGELVLADLGLVTKIGEKGRHGVGTKGYAAPEQLIDGTASVRSDVFSIGKILKSAAGGRLPHRLRTVVRKATHEDPEERYADAVELANAVVGSRWGRILPYVAAALVLAVAVRFAVSWLAPERPDPKSADCEKFVKLGEERIAEQSKPRTFAEILALAESGDSNAQADVAERYYYGRGVETNKAEAVRWYVHAAEAGHLGAKDSLGLCYLYGYGCVRDPVKAAKFFTEAAEEEHPSAMNNLAFCYRNGIGVERDEHKAFVWAKMAADKGHAPSETMVAECYLEGRGVEKDVESAMIWLRRAARKGNARAKMLLKAHESDSVREE